MKRIAIAMFLAASCVLSGGCVATPEDGDEEEAEPTGVTEDALLPSDCTLSVTWTSLGTSYLWGTRSAVTCTKTHASFTVSATVSINGGSSTTRTATCSNRTSCSVVNTPYDLQGSQQYVSTTVADVDGQSLTRTVYSTH